MCTKSEGCAGSELHISMWALCVHKCGCGKVQIRVKAGKRFICVYMGGCMKVNISVLVLCVHKEGYAGSRISLQKVRAHGRLCFWEPCVHTRGLYSRYVGKPSAQDALPALVPPPRPYPAAHPPSITLPQFLIYVAHTF